MERVPMAVYEGTTTIPVFNLELAPNNAQTINMEFKILKTRG